MKRILYALIIALIISKTALAVSITPPEKNLGTINQTTITDYTLLNSIKVHNFTLNITFEVVTPKSIQSSISFTPANIILNRTTSTSSFNVTINPVTISNGDYSLVFKAVVNVMENLSANVSGKIDATGIVISEPTASLNFIVPQVSATTTTQTTTPSSGGGGGGTPSTTIPPETKNLEIIAPYLIETNQSTTIEIRVKNTGNTTLTNLRIEFKSKFPLDIFYDNIIGTLKQGEEKIVSLVISPPQQRSNLIDVIVSSPENRWADSILIRSPSMPKAGVDCIELEERKFYIEANKYSEITLNLTNKCSFSLHDVSIVIDNLFFSRKIDVIEERAGILLRVALPEGAYGYKLITLYSEGSSENAITIVSQKISQPIILDIMFLLFIIILIILVIIAFLKGTSKSIRKKTKEKRKT